MAGSVAARCSGGALEVEVRIAIPARPGGRYRGRTLRVDSARGGNWRASRRWHPYEEAPSIDNAIVAMSQETCWTLIRAAGAGDMSARRDFTNRYLVVVRAYLGSRWSGTP